MQSRASVLIVEDHFMFGEALAGMLRESGELEVVGIAVTGPQAISKARERQPAAVILDFHIPGTTGEELIGRITEASPASKIVVLTSDSSEAAVAKAVTAGAAAYLLKDRAVDDIMRTLRTVLAGRPALTEEQLAVTTRATTGRPGESLTIRETEVINLLARGRDPAGIAQDLSLSIHTVRTHLQNAFSKLGARSQIEAVAIARDRGLLGTGR